MALLEVRELRAGYDHLPVLQGVSFTVEEGETAVIFGLNGAGKTTTLLTLAGLLRPTGGSVRFLGREVAGKPSHVLAAMGLVLVPEGRRVFPGLSVEQNLLLGAWPARREGRIRETMGKILEYFPPLSQRLSQKAGTLSGGEQQMLAIARALMARPRLLLVDEASLGLSPVMARTVFEVLAAIKGEGPTLLLVEQNVGVLPYAERVIIMEKGVVVFEGVGEEARAVRLRESYLGG